jgi:hypothetical protein
MVHTLATTLRLLSKRYLALVEELTTLDVMLEQLSLKHAGGFVNDSALGFKRPSACCRRSRQAGTVEKRCRARRALWHDSIANINGPCLEIFRRIAHTSPARDGSTI